MRGPVQQDFFAVVADPQSYLNIFYLLLAFPLGTAYFVFLVTGLALGFGMSITLAGIPILLLVLAVSWVLCEFERRLAVGLLKEDIPQHANRPTSEGIWARLKAHLSNRLTWTGILYLFLKFPIGIASFVMVVTLGALTLGLLFTPAYYAFAQIAFGPWIVDVWWEALLCTLVGVPVLFISLYLMNGAAFISGRFTRMMLDKTY